MADSVKSVRARLEFARALEETTIKRHREAWGRTLNRIATNPRYGGMQMTPQLGLIPLGRDPDSGLEEFAHAASGSAPERHPATGRLKLLGGDPGGTGVVLVLIPGGAFLAGAQKTDPNAPNHDPRAGTEDAPLQKISLDPFFISKYEFTQNQWRVLTKSDPSFYRVGKRISGKFVNVLHPVEQVSWTECDRLATRLGLTLPTDAQWEYCCRAGTTTPWYTGPEERSLIGHANVADADGARAHPAGWQHEADWNDGYAAHAPVGTYDANPWGLHDMHGNVWEWVRDPWEIPPSPPRSGDGYRAHTPAAPRAYRGGSFEGVAELARSSTRTMLGPDMKLGIIGFRPVRTVDR